jgi:hypothetical protein
VRQFLEALTMLQAGSGGQAKLLLDKAVASLIQQLNIKCYGAEGMLTSSASCQFFPIEPAVLMAWLTG